MPHLETRAIYMPHLYMRREKPPLKQHLQPGPTVNRVSYNNGCKLLFEEGNGTYSTDNPLTSHATRRIPT